MGIRINLQSNVKLDWGTGKDRSQSRTKNSMGPRKMAQSYCHVRMGLPGHHIQSGIMAQICILTQGRQRNENSQSSLAVS